ncbi:MAG: M28 family peptidase, partial [Longimicrobiales bacterium]
MDVRGFGLTEEEMRALGYRVPGEPDRGGDEGSEQPPEVRGERPAQRWLWTLVFLAALGWGASFHRRLPDPVPANRSDTLFSSARAMSQLVEIARRPHPPGSPEHDRVRDYLIDRLRALGLNPRVQTTTSVVVDSGTARAMRIRNIVARLPGAASSGAVVLTAHYDTPPLSPGAGDDGVGVAALLETLRALLAGEPLRNDLIVLLSDGGALGQSGIRAFVETHPWMAGVTLVISAEMEGVSGPAFLFESEPENGRLIEVLAASDSRPTATSLSREIPSDQPFGRAVSSFREAGIPGLSLLGLGGRSVHHQVTDHPERVSEKTLQHQGSQLLSMARALGDVDLGRPSGLKGPDQAYLSIPFRGLVHYPLDWASLISLGLACGWILMTALLRLRGASWKGLLAGTLLGVILGIGAAGIGWGVFTMVRPLHPEYCLLESAFYRDGVHFLALA